MPFVSCLGLVVAVATAAAACSGGTPTSPTGTPSPAVAPFTLSKGDKYIIEFRVNPTLWAGSVLPDTLVVSSTGGGEADGAEECAIVEIFDGARRLGRNAKASSCWDFTFTQIGTALSPGNPNDAAIDFSAIQAGAIEGRVEIQILAKRMTSNGLYTIDLNKNVGGGHYTGVAGPGTRAGGVTITSQTIIR